MTSRKTFHKKTSATPATVKPQPSKIQTLIELLKRPNGASIDNLAAAATGWQHHSIRGALAGTLKRKGFVVTSGKTDGLRRYRIEGQE